MATRRSLATFKQGTQVRGFTRSRSGRSAPVEEREVFTVEGIMAEFGDVPDEHIEGLANTEYAHNDPFYSVDTASVARTNELPKLFEGVSNLIETLHSVNKGQDIDIVKANIQKAITTGTPLNVNTPDYDSIMEKVKEEQEIEAIVEGRDDIGECLQCGCKILIMRSMQTSRGDEATAIIYNCAACKAGRGKLKIY